MIRICILKQKKNYIYFHLMLLYILIEIEDNSHFLLDKNQNF